MILVPFIFFALLTAFLWWRHQCFDVCVYMSSLYTFTSLMAVILVTGDLLEEGGILFDAYDIQLSPIPTLFYCGFITIGILPFSMLYKKDLKIIETPNPGIIYIASWFLIAVSLLNLYLVGDSTLEILSGDLSTVRSDHYSGIESPAQIKAQGLPYILRFLYYFNASTILALPLFFYYLCFEKRSWWFNTLLFFASLSMPIAGIQSVDRTEVIFYSMMFLSCITLFNKFISKRVKRIMKISLIPISLLMIVYLVAVTDARFSDRRENGALAYTAEYAGQSYINFCFFWEKANWDYPTTERILPMYNHYIKHIDNDDQRRDVRSGQQGFFMSVFASYIGDIMLDITPIGLSIWVLVFFLITVIVLVRPHRDEISVGDYLIFYALSAIPIFGIFYYRYMSYPYSFMLIFVVIIYTLDQFDIRFSNKEKDYA